jgi:hypothetical protein
MQAVRALRPPLRPDAPASTRLVLASVMRLGRPPHVLYQATLQPPLLQRPPPRRDHHPLRQGHHSPCRVLRLPPPRRLLRGLVRTCMVRHRPFPGLSPLRRLLPLGPCRSLLLVRSPCCLCCECADALRSLLAVSVYARRSRQSGHPQGSPSGGFRRERRRYQGA